MPCSGYTHHRFSTVFTNREHRVQTDTDDIQMRFRAICYIMMTYTCVYIVIIFFSFSFFFRTPYRTLFLFSSDWSADHRRTYIERPSRRDPKHVLARSVCQHHRSITNTIKHDISYIPIYIYTYTQRIISEIRLANNNAGDLPAEQQ